MGVLRVGSLIDAPHVAVRRALVGGQLWRRVGRATGGRIAIEASPPHEEAGAAEDSTDDRHLAVGSRLVLQGPANIDALHRPLTLTVTAVADTRPGSEVRGHSVLSLRGERGLRVAVDAIGTDAGTLVEFEVRWHGGRIRAAFSRRRILRLGELMVSIALLSAHDSPVVVAGAVVRAAGGPARLLAAQRGPQQPHPGRWELPGGKVDLGESDELALRRELAEELGIDAEIGHRVGAEIELPDGSVLRTYRAVTDDTPTPVEHAVVRWLVAGELDSVDWLEADRRLIPALAGLLERPLRNS